MNSAVTSATIKVAGDFFNTARVNPLVGVALAVIFFFSFIIYLAAKLAVAANPQLAYFTGLAILLAFGAVTIFAVVATKHKPTSKRRA